MQRRHDELRSNQYVSLFQQISGASIPDETISKIVHGADEVDLVRSGLDDTMRLAYQEMRNELMVNDSINDLRTAAFAIAIKKISRTYVDIGIY